MAEKKAAFDIKSMLNTTSIQQATQNKKRINYKNLIPHEKNHYSLNNIEELADSIEDIGLQQELVVKPAEDGINYTIIIGHRRHLAFTMLIEERLRTDLQDIPCVVLDKNEDELLSLLKLHLTNTTAREMTEHDKMIAISELKELIRDAKEKGLPIKGKVRDIIAESVNLGSTQVQKYLNINEQASKEVKDALKSGEITVQEAYDTTRPKKIKPALNITDTEDASGKVTEDDPKEETTDDLIKQQQNITPPNSAMLEARSNFNWVKINLVNKNSLPPMGETVIFYSESEGYFFGWINENQDNSGRKQYYYYLGQEHNNRAVKGKKIWWQKAPGKPFGAK